MGTSSETFGSCVLIRTNEIWGYWEVGDFRRFYSKSRLSLFWKTFEFLRCRLTFLGQPSLWDAPHREGKIIGNGLLSITWGIHWTGFTLLTIKRNSPERYCTYNLACNPYRKSHVGNKQSMYSLFVLCFIILQYFTGNRDQNTVVSHPLVPNIKSRFVRVMPWGWYGHISMRVEFYGCLTGLWSTEVVDLGEPLPRYF